MDRHRLIEILSVPIHQFAVHMLDSLKDYGDVGVQSLYERWYKPYKELKEEDKMPFRLWAIRIVNLLEAYKVIHHVEEDQKRGEEGS